eukprot:gb/GECH01012811.1/.p1 GENE.gb/GECH01012811.1/~~gb/GECH01012811.1/.p1  ORF type:complete len:338 (+),score=61.32 gb/GECH01012811.1/:1-1014(+)
MENQNSNQPANTRFKQQNLPAWQPVLSPTWVIGTFFIVAVIFIPVGAVLLSVSNSVHEQTIRYDDECEMQTQSAGNLYCNARLEFEITQEMKSPVYMYYRLDGFYQNHRRYSQSKSDAQLAGKEVGLVSDCAPHRYYGDNASDEEREREGLENPSRNSSLIYNPCGLIAYSMFNDTFVLRTSDNNVICDGPSPENSDCKKKGIAWPADRNVKFKQGDHDNWSFPQTYHNEPTHPLPNVTDEDFMVWMRTSALSSFRKLYRIIETDLTPGTYEIDIDQHFPVSDFGGKKYFVLSTTTALGGKNVFMGAAYITVGCLCGLVGVVFTIRHVFNLRKNNVN